MTARDSQGRLDRGVFYSCRYLGHTGQSLYLAGMLLAAGAGSSLAVGLSGVMAATMVAALLFALPAGALADRLGPARGYSLGATLRFASIAGGLLLVGHPAFAWIVAFVYSASSQVFSPSELALVPVVHRGSPARAHTILVGLQYGGQATGAVALAPLLFLLGGSRAVFGGAAVVYVAVVAVSLLLALRLPKATAVPGVPGRGAFSLRETYRFLASEPRAAYAVGLLAFVDMAAKCTLVALPVYLAVDLGLGRAGMAVVLAPAGVGVAIGMAWAARRFALHLAPRVMRLTLAGAVVAVVSLAALDRGLGLAFSSIDLPLFAHPDVTPGVALALPMALLLGLCFTLAPIGARAVLSELAPRGQQARVFASQATLTEMFVILPLVTAGFGTEFAGPRATFAFIAVMGLIVLLLLETAMPARRGTLAIAPAT